LTMPSDDWVCPLRPPVAVAVAVNRGLILSIKISRSFAHKSGGLEHGSASVPESDAAFALRLIWAAPSAMWQHRRGETIYRGGIRTGSRSEVFSRRSSARRKDS